MDEKEVKVEELLKVYDEQVDSKYEEYTAYATDDSCNECAEACCVCYCCCGL